MARKVDYRFIKQVDTEEGFQSMVLKAKDTLVVVGALCELRVTWGRCAVGGLSMHVALSTILVFAG